MLKKEVQGLQNVEKTIAAFEKHWLKPIKTSTNKHLPFLQDLCDNRKKELNAELAALKGILQQIKSGQRINEKLQHYARYLVELKLAEIQGNVSKSASITNTLLRDDFLNVSQTIQDITLFDSVVTELGERYHDILEMMHGDLSLEESVAVMEQPHHVHLRELHAVAREQKRLVHALGKSFVMLAREKE